MSILRRICLLKLSDFKPNNLLKQYISTTSVLQYDFKEVRRRRKALYRQAVKAEICAKKGVETPETAAFVKPYGFNDMFWRKGKFRPVHTWETSVKYMESQMYKNIYGDQPVYVPYRRNAQPVFFQRQLPMHNCAPLGIFQTNYPCPICRDEYLVVDYRNLKLLMQFVIPSTARIEAILKVQVCQRQYFNLEMALARAKSVGYLDFGVPHRNYNYKDYYEWWDGPSEKPVPEEPEDYDGAHEIPYIRYPTHNREWWPQYNF